MSETPNVPNPEKPSVDEAHTFEQTPNAEPTAEPVAPPAASSAQEAPLATNTDSNPQPSHPDQGYQQPGHQQPAYAQQPYAQPGYPGGAEQKSKIAAGLLGIFLGSLGIHNFYLGFTGKALTQLLLSVLSLGLLSPIIAIWGLIEGILILTGSQNFRADAKGVPLRD